MLITYERFGTQPLPIYDPSEPIGAFGTRSSFLDLPGGGAARGYGSEQAPQSSRVLRRSGTLLGASLVEVDAALAALCARRGTVERLYARRSDGAVVWTMAELSSVDALREPRALFRGCPDVALDVETEFVLFDPPWRGTEHGDGWTFDAGYRFDSGQTFDDAIGNVFALSVTDVTSIPLVNGGNATVLDPILTIVAGPAAITAISITTTGPDGNQQAQLLYSGTVDAGRTFRLDAGRQAVEQNNPGGFVGDYEHLTFDVSHLIPGWLRLDPGTTTVEVVITTAGGYATLYAFYSDGWA